jgi:glucokinase
MTQYDSPVVAVDIGGTKIMTAVFSADGRMLARDVCPTIANEGVDAVVERLKSAIEGILKRHELSTSRLAGIGIACAGGIDSASGIVVTPSPNLPGWSDLPLRDIIEERFNVNTYVLNDASSAALGEQRSGAGQGVKNLVLVTLGTGIGGGIIIDGQLYLGARGSAGEIGHITVDEGGPVCGCGNTGCLEVMSSGRAIAREAVSRISQGEKSSLTEMAGGKLADITSEQVAATASAGDSLALDVISRAAHYLGVGLVNIVNAFNPEMIILGGGMAELANLFVEPAKKLVEERAFSVSTQELSIVTATLGNEAGVYGAAAYVIEKKPGGRHEDS